jgi:hypothetical protein
LFGLKFNQTRLCSPSKEVRNSIMKIFDAISRPFAQYSIIAANKDGEIKVSYIEDGKPKLGTITSAQMKDLAKATLNLIKDSPKTSRAYFEWKYNLMRRL